MSTRDHSIPSSRADFDGSAAFLFRDFVGELAVEGVTLILANPNKTVLLALQRSRIIIQMGPENVQLTMKEAVARARQVVAAHAAEKAV